MGKSRKSRKKSKKPHGKSKESQATAAGEKEYQPAVKAGIPASVQSTPKQGKWFSRLFRRT